MGFASGGSAPLHIAPAGAFNSSAVGSTPLVRGTGCSTNIAEYTAEAELHSGEGAC